MNRNGILGRVVGMLRNGWPHSAEYASGTISIIFIILTGAFAGTVDDCMPLRYGKKFRGVLIN